MTSLLKAWLLDPLVLLFLLSLLLTSVLLIGKRRGSRRAGRARSRIRTRGSNRRGLRLLLVWISAFLFCSAPVIVNPLIATLENPYLEVPACAAGSHLVVLGGGVDSRVVDASEFGRMGNATLTRATATAGMALAELDTRIIVAGGAVGKVAEAEVIASYLQRLGVNGDRLIKEADSATTRENALNVAGLLQAESIEGPVRLITSAMHMPRALLSFRQVLADSDIEVCPVSVDVQALKDVPWYALMPQTTAITRFEMLLHEAVALLVYRIKGWI
ncbi:YdcF family protein [Granulosicoccus sp. 3-233]|uniref:YdcF family protein n=1 Tax=Granulosicoccus sp. 3-233 TaxID=3417969 RepID=UPI003D352551